MEYPFQWHRPIIIHAAVFETQLLETQRVCVNQRVHWITCNWKYQNIKICIDFAICLLNMLTNNFAAGSYWSENFTVLSFESGKSNCSCFWPSNGEQRVRSWGLIWCRYRKLIPALLNPTFTLHVWWATIESYVAKGSATTSGWLRDKHANKRKHKNTYSPIHTVTLRWHYRARLKM